MRYELVAAVAAIHGDGHGGQRQTWQRHRIGLVAFFSGKELSGQVVQSRGLVGTEFGNELLRLLLVINDGVASPLQPEAVVGTLVDVEG